MHQIKVFYFDYYFLYFINIGNFILGIFKLGHIINGSEFGLKESCRLQNCRNLNSYELEIFQSKKFTTLKFKILQSQETEQET